MTIGEVTLAFGVGVGATLSPCALPLYPGFLAFLSAREGATGQRLRPFLGFFVLAGVLTMMLILGAVIAGLAAALGSVLAILTPAADVVVVGLGILLLVGINPFMRLPVPGLSPRAGNAPLAAYVYGLLYGPIALPCSGPLLVSIFSISLSAREALPQIALFLVFGLGFGLPLLLISLVAGARQALLTRWFLRHERVVSRVSGAVLVLVGSLDFYANIPNVRLYLGI